jgi:hypothetical protein
MKQYLLSIYMPAGETPSPDFLARVMDELDALRRELEEGGSWVFGEGLHSPDSATVVRQEGDELLTTDGPFVEGKEYLGGITIIRTPDLDAALEWAGRYARATTLPIEVRPFQGPGD